MVQEIIGKRTSIIRKIVIEKALDDIILPTESLLDIKQPSQKKCINKLEV